MPNGLAKTSSPYLLMHAHQEVDWHPWGEEAWAEARRRNVPVFVSLGYASCHWCHVMSHESFDDPAIAAKLNESFVCIKVDREEHPDVDAVFMTTTQAMTGSGGWPNSVFCTPEGNPFFAGTYFPPEAVGGMPSFGEVLDALASAWAERRDEVVASGTHIVEQLQQVAGVPTGESTGEPAALRELRQRIADEFDPIHGGWGGAPKFPPAMLVDGLLVGGDPGELEMATHTLEAMARGGIHDQLGGGFHRYSVDAGWVVPHFEKMLYDNALLLGTYTRGWRRTPDHNAWLRSFFEHVVRRCVGWLEREMRTDNGLFASALDADSSDAHARVHEGIYYVWNPELLHDALGAEDADWAAQVFHVTNLGTFEHGLSTLLLHGHPDPERLARVQDKLFAERSTRFAPYRDELVVAAWNGWLVDSLVQAAMVFGEAGWLELARTTAQALWDVHVTPEPLAVARSSFEGTATAPGTLEDYAALALGFARLAGALGEREWLDRAVALLEAADARFAAGDGGWFDADSNKLLFARPRDVADAATPSGTSTMVAALHLAGLLAERDDLVAKAEAGAATQAAWLASYPRTAGWAFEQAMISDEARRGLKRATVVVAVPGDDPMALMNRAAWRMAPAGSALVTLRPGQQWGTLGLDRDARGEDGTVYTCRGPVCFAPADAVDELKTPLWSRC